MKFLRSYSLIELAYFLNADIRYGKSCFLVYGISDFFSASVFDIVVLFNSSYLKYVNKIKPAAIVMRYDLYNFISCSCLLVYNPRLSLAKLSTLCINRRFFFPGLSNNVLVGSNTRISRLSKVSDYVVLGNNVLIKSFSCILSGVVIGDNCVIGKNCLIGSNTVLFRNVIIGDRSSIGSNSVLASNGFGYAVNEFLRVEKIEHFGCVIIGSDVDIGCGVFIDRGVFRSTIIGNNVSIDNGVQIGHNAFICDSVLIAGLSAVGGSSFIGRYSLLGGCVKISDHLFVSSKVFIAGSSVIAKSVLTSGIYSSVFYAIKSIKWNRLLYFFYKLDLIYRNLK